MKASKNTTHALHLQCAILWLYPIFFPSANKAPYVLIHQDYFLFIHLYIFRKYMPEAISTQDLVTLPITSQELGRGGGLFCPPTKIGLSNSPTTIGFSM